MHKFPIVSPALLALLFAAPLHAASLPDTGQALCDNGSNVMEPCSNTNSGDASTMPRQDARFGHDPAAGVTTKVGAGAAGFDYSKVANDGSTVAAATVLGSNATDWACTQDNITSLMWEVKTTDAGLRDKNWTYSWYNADGATNGGNAGTANGGTCLDTVNCDTEKYVAQVNTANLCGHGDWRLPSRRELESLTHFGTTFPAIDTTYFPNTLANAYFWSGSGSVSTASPFAAWIVGSGIGFSVTTNKINGRKVRLVRGGPF